MQDKTQLINILSTVFSKDGIQNVTKLFEYDSANSHKLEVSIDETLCGFLLYESKDQFKNDSVYVVNDYMMNIIWNTRQTKKLMTQNDIYVSLVVVNPIFQKQGFGKSLLKLLAEQNKNKEYLYLWADNTCNNRFYEKLKFENIKQFDTPYGYHTIIYRKKIDKFKEEIE